METGQLTTEQKWVKKKIKKESKNFLVFNKSENTAKPKPMDTRRVILRGKFIVLCPQ